MQKMQCDSEGWGHTRLANHGMYPDGSWVHVVSEIMIKFQIPSFQPVQSLTLSQFKAQLKQYRVKEVEPRLGILPAPQLPWQWISAAASHKFSPLSFEVWWHCRLFGTLGKNPLPSCRLCECEVEPTSEHLQKYCVVFASLAEQCGVDRQSCLDLPVEQDGFCRVLQLFAEVANRHGLK